MRRKRCLTTIGGAVSAAILAGAMPTMAHHSFASEYDASKQVELRGKVQRMEWINPHAWIQLEVVVDDGRTEVWRVEGAAPNALFRRGFNKNSLPHGTEIIVTGFQSKDGSKRANGNQLTLTDGTSLFLGSSGTGAPYNAPANR